MIFHWKPISLLFLNRVFIQSAETLAKKKQAIRFFLNATTFRLDRRSMIENWNPVARYSGSWNESHRSDWHSKQPMRAPLSLLLPPISCFFHSLSRHPQCLPSSLVSLKMWHNLPCPQRWAPHRCLQRRTPPWMLPESRVPNLCLRRSSIPSGSFMSAWSCSCSAYSGLPSDTITTRGRLAAVIPSWPPVSSTQESFYLARALICAPASTTSSSQCNAEVPSVRAACSPSARTVKPETLFWVPNPPRSGRKRILKPREGNSAQSILHGKCTCLRWNMIGGERMESECTLVFKTMIDSFQLRTVISFCCVRVTAFS